VDHKRFLARQTDSASNGVAYGQATVQICPRRLLRGPERRGRRHRRRERLRFSLGHLILPFLDRRGRPRPPTKSDMCRYVVGDELSDQRIRIGAGPRRRGAKLCGEIGSNHLLRVQPLRAPSFPWSLRYLDNSRSPRGPRVQVWSARPLRRRSYRRIRRRLSFGRRDGVKRK
jgi:hypothetical protein